MVQGPNMELIPPEWVYLRTHATCRVWTWELMHSCKQETSSHSTLYCRLTLHPCLQCTEVTLSQSSLPMWLVALSLWLSSHSTTHHNLKSRPIAVQPILCSCLHVSSLPKAKEHLVQHHRAQLTSQTTHHWLPWTMLILEYPAPSFRLLSGKLFSMNLGPSDIVMVVGVIFNRQINGGERKLIHTHAGYSTIWVIHWIARNNGLYCSLIGG